MPTIQRDLHFSQASLAWVIDAYLITFAGTLLLAGRLGDLFGRKKVFLVGVALFTVASIACGAADSQILLVSARFVQGLGAALSSSVILAIIVADFPVPGERAKAMSSYIIVAVGGGSLGLLIGGYVTQALSWHWIFFINIPIGIATFVAGAVLIEENTGIGFRAGLDIAGAILSTAGLMLAVYAIVSSSQYGWNSTHTLGFGSAAIVVLGIFLLLESRLATPMMPMPVLRSPGLLTSSLVRGLMVVGMYSTFFIGVLYFQHVLGYDPIRTGLAFLPQTLSVALMSAGRDDSHHGPAGTEVDHPDRSRRSEWGSHPVHQLRCADCLLSASLRGGAAGRSGRGDSIHTVADHGLGQCPGQGRRGRIGNRERLPTGVGGALGGSPRSGLQQPHRPPCWPTAVRSPDALDGGYRLAFTIALVSVLAGIVVGVVVLKRTGARHEHPEVTGELEAESETMISEVL